MDWEPLAEALALAESRPRPPTEVPLRNRSAARHPPVALAFVSRVFFTSLGGVRKKRRWNDRKGIAS